MTITDQIDFSAEQWCGIEDAYIETTLRDWPADEILKNNLDSLRQRDLSPADAIAGIRIPETAEMVVANDGSVTFRFRRPDGSRAWLGNSSIPTISAEANLKRTTIGAGNLAMNGIGNGADAFAILESMSPFQALVVIEPDPLMVNLSFRLRDFTRMLSTGQLVILLGDDPKTLLTELFDIHPGYNAISEAFSWTWLTDQANQQFAKQISFAMEQVMRNTSGAVNELLSSRKERNLESLKKFQPSNAHTLRAVNCSNSYSITDYCAARDMLSGLEQLGAWIDWLVMDKPDCVSHHAQLARLNRTEPDLILLVDALRGDISTVLPGSAVCATLLREPPPSLTDPEAKSDRKLGEHDFIFYCRRRQHEKLIESNFPGDRLFYLPPGANDAIYKPIDLSPADAQRYSSEIIMVADRFSSDPETYNIKLPTHQQLWQTVIEDIQHRPGDYYRESARKYFIRAQRCGIELQDEQLRDFFTELIGNYLGDSVLRDCYCETLAKEGFNLKIHPPAALRSGPGDTDVFWKESPVSDLAADPIADGSELNKLFNGGKIFLHIDGSPELSLSLLNGIAAGAFFLVRSHPGHLKPDGLGQFFKLGRELITFTDPKDLVRKTRYFLEHPDQRIQLAKAAREKLLSQHTYRHRAEQLLQNIASHHLST